MPIWRSPGLKVAIIRCRFREKPSRQRQRIDSRWSQSNEAVIIYSDENPPRIPESDFGYLLEPVPRCSNKSMFRATQARAQATPNLPALFDIQKIADGVYAAVAKPTAVLNCNAAIFENSDYLAGGRHALEAVGSDRVSGSAPPGCNKKPVRYVVNSHFHWDHSREHRPTGR